MPNASGLSSGRRYCSKAHCFLEGDARGAALAEEGEAPEEGGKKEGMSAAFANGADGGFGEVSV